MVRDVAREMHSGWEAMMPCPPVTFVELPALSDHLFKEIFLDNYAHVSSWLLSYCSERNRSLSIIYNKNRPVQRGMK